jgi:hypothetical protein
VRHKRSQNSRAVYTLAGEVMAVVDSLMWNSSSYLSDSYRSDLKLSRTSVTKSSGSPHAALKIEIPLYCAALRQNERARKLSLHDPRSAATINSRTEITMNFETIKVRQEGAVLFAEMSAPPMNLLGPELVHDLVSLIQQAEADAGRVGRSDRTASLTMHSVEQHPYPDLLKWTSRINCYRIACKRSADMTLYYF